MAEEDEVPPLEDMSEMLRAATKLLEGQSQVATSDSVSDVARTADTALANVQSPKNSDSKAAAAVKSPKDLDTKAKSSTSKDDTEELKSAIPSAPSESQKSFGGMKKGFLLASGGKKQSKSQATRPAKPKVNVDSSIPFIKPKESKKDSQVLPEVQKAIEAAKGLSAMKEKEWVTDDLLKRVTSHPMIGPKLSNPKFVDVLKKFQANPQLAMKEYGDNPEMESFIRELLLILGDHFTSLGDKQNPQPKQETAEPSREDLATLQNLLAQENVKEALDDPRIRQLIQQLRDEPDKAQQLLTDSSRDASFHRRINTLIQAGLLGVSSESGKAVGRK